MKITKIMSVQFKQPAPIRKKAYIYVRVSTAGQVIVGQSLDTQTGKCKEWISQHHQEYSLEGIFIEGGISGKKDSRKKLNEMRKTVKKDDVIVLYSIHRLARKLTLWLNLYDEMEKKGVRIICAAENIDTFDKKSHLIANIYAVVAQHEAEQIQERTKHNFDAKRKRGELCNGKPPYGYGAYKGLNGINYSYPKSDEQRVIDIIINHREASDPPKSWTRIGNFLRARGFQPKDGGLEWYSETLRQIYAREKKAREDFPILKDWQCIELYERHRVPHIVPMNLIREYLVDGKEFDHERYNNKFHPGANYTANHYIPSLQQLKIDVEEGNIDVSEEDKALIRCDFDEEKCKEMNDPLIKRVIENEKTRDIYLQNSSHMPDFEARKRFAAGLISSFGVG